MTHAYLLDGNLAVWREYGEVQPGDVFADRFQVEQLAGAGGMGAVYRARDRVSDATVALKVLLSTEGSQAERFVREARVLADIESPHVVRYVAHGLAPSGELYIAMEWLEGEDLQVRLGREGLTIAESVDLVTRAATGLAAAHARGVVHRDLKPSNLFLEGRDIMRLKILDFGIALTRVDASIAAMTRTGVIMGTPGYMAPEQARGERGLDGRADVFALGCVLYECLTGEAPFVGEHLMATLAKILLEDPPRVRTRRDVPDELDDLVARMLAKRPEDRPADAGALLGTLAALPDITKDGARRLRPSRSPPALTGGEQRYVSVVLAAGGDGATPGAAVEAARTGQADGHGGDRSRNDATIADPFGHATRAGVASALAPFGGKADWLLDGSVVVTVSGSGAATDIASRAVRCALGMREQMLDRDIVVVTGRTSTTQRLPVGEAIERAVSLARARAHPGAAPFVRIDDVTAGLLDATFDVRREPAGFVVVGERAAENVRTLLGKPTPLVGREREMATLLAVFDECRSEPAARAVLLTAPAGVGKSRLRYELLRAVRDRSPAGQVWMARGDPMGAGSPFGMLARALRGAADLLDGEPIEAAHAKLEARVARSVPLEHVQRVSEFLAVLAGVPFRHDRSVLLRAAHQDPLLMGDQIRRAFEDFVHAETRRGPLLLVLEDLHWGDLPSVKCVDDVLRNLHEQPLMVLALARPEVHAAFPGLWEERGTTELRLSGLSRKASERLVREVLGAAASEDLAARLAQRADGNAFYLEELIRAASEGNDDGLPETVLAMVQARLEALEPEARRILRAASIFGQTFWLGGVRALVGGGAAGKLLKSRLDDAQRRELVSLRPAGRFPGEPEYVFRHALVREAAYGMLTETDCVLGHKLAGGWLERTGERDAVVLAEHFERGGVPSSAALWYKRGAEQAFEGNDYDAAIARADRAIDCGADGEVRGALRLLQAVANRWGGTIAETERCAEDATRGFAPGHAAWFDAMGWRLWASSRLGHVDRTAQPVHELLGTEPAPGANGASLFALCRAACQMASAGGYADAEALMRRAEQRTLAAQLEQGSPLVEAYLNRARAFLTIVQEGDLGQAARYFAASADAFERAGDARGACLERLNLGNTDMHLGAYDDALAVLQQGHAVAIRLGLPPMKAYAENNLGMVAARLGRRDDGAGLEELAADGYAVLGDKSLTSVSASYLARIQLESGDLDGAALSAARGVREAANHPVARAFALAVGAAVHLAAGRGAEALSAARDAKALLDDLGTIEDGEQLTRLVFAEALHACGDLAMARRAIDDARDALLARAAKIRDDRLRRGFLERVPENARTLQLAREWSDRPDSLT